MTTTFKRRIYRLSLLSATSFLIGILLYDLGDAGVAIFQSYAYCDLMLLMGVVLGFKAMDTWSSWNEDTSEDSSEKLHLRNVYPVTFYLEAGIMVLLVFLLLAFADVRSQPSIQEMVTSFLALLLAGACVLIGRLSSYLE